ncbi:MAG: hypothetical protein R2729_07440 [Bryobacteraceae bacterium]
MEYRLDSGHRHSRELAYRRDLNPMRCSCCRRPIPLARRILGMECCSHACSVNLPAIRNNPTKAVEFAREREAAYAKWTRGAFAATLVAGALGFGRRLDWAAAIGSPEGKTAGRVRETDIADWSRYRSEAPSDWSGAGKLDAPWRIESGWMQPLGAVLYRAMPLAASGSLAYRFSLADSGRARFLLGADGSGRTHELEVDSDARYLRLRASRIEGRERSRLEGVLDLARMNRSMHDLRIDFDNGTLRAVINGKRADWSGVSLPPGMVGLDARPMDNLRVYQAHLALESVAS